MANEPDLEAAKRALQAAGAALELLGDTGPKVQTVKDAINAAWYALGFESPPPCR